MGIELELGVLLALHLVGTSVLAPFEAETPPWRRILKWTVITALTLGLVPFVGHGALWVPTLFVSAGLVFHLAWCRRNGIDALRATPRKRYYALRGWTWPDA